MYLIFILFYIVDILEVSLGIKCKKLVISEKELIVVICEK